MSSASRLHWIVIFACALALAAPVAAETEPAADPTAKETPTEVVEKLHAALLDAMKNADELGYQGRYDRLEPVLLGTFDIPFMAEKSVGRHWKRFDEDRRAHLVDTFSRFTVANYAGRFDGWSGQSFETLREEPSTHGLVLVHTRLNDPDGEDVQLNYRLKPSEDGWRIVDVYLNGTVSELALRRSEYSSLIKREGYEALIAALDERIAELAAAAPADQAG